MPKPLFVFTQYKNSFSVHIPNLEELSVEQIKQSQDFVQQRHGYFDFSTYSFSIQKKINFEEFSKIVLLSELNAIMQENKTIVKSMQKISFGKYKGLLYSELPDSYLKWLKTNYMGREREEIALEIQSRGL
ncbi:DUF3820 family protein [Sulfurimonas sp.]|uniref:putative quorum-sensing-regulated virulence factor n=1 Tax=Sulfurimonas sp. TaxID=2022749 RepID=UPI00260C9BE1|nr:DUF3820 family protein [Sulfurimonas sp.]